MIFLPAVLFTLAMSAAQATTIWDFGTDVKADANTDFGDLGPPPPADIACRGVTESSATLTACGYNANGTPHELHFKDANPPVSPDTNEHGLGLADTTDNELTLQSDGSGGYEIANFMQIDLGAIYLTWSNPQVRMQSVTQDEHFDVFGSNTEGVLGTLLIGGATTNNLFLPVPGAFTYRYLGVAVNPTLGSLPNNVLLDAFSADPPTGVPEPSTVVLLGGGLLLFGPLIRRQRRQ